MRRYVAQWCGSWAAQEMGACFEAVLLDTVPEHSTLQVSLEPMPSSDLRRERGHRTVQPWSKEIRMRLARPLTCPLAVSVVLTVACVHALMRSTDPGATVLGRDGAGRPGPPPRCLGGADNVGARRCLALPGVGVWAMLGPIAPPR
jgi:hypothetical protein